jgi:PAS domain S-box-containing protein
LKHYNLFNKWTILISSIFGVFALILILADIHFTIPGTQVLTDPREIFVLISAALTGPIGAVITGVLASVYDPTPSFRIYVICQHIFGAVLVSLIYKRYIFEKFIMPLSLIFWVLLVLAYYYVFYIPGYLIVYSFFPDIYNIISANNTNPFSALINLYSGWTFEIVFTTLITVLFIIALPQRFRKPFWGKHVEPAIGEKQRKITSRIYSKFFSQNYLGWRLGIWYLLLSLIPFFVIQAFINNNIYEQFVQFSIDKHKINVEAQNFESDSLIIIEQKIIEPESEWKYYFISLSEDKITEEELIKLKNNYRVNSDKKTFVDYQLDLIVTKEIDYDSNAIIFFYSSIKSIDLLLGSLESKASRNLGISLILITLLAGVTVWLIIVHPIKKLTLALKEVGDGNYKVKIPDNEMDDELNVMAKSFNDMTQKIKFAYEQVAEEVENRSLAEAIMIKSEDNLKRITNNILDVVFETDTKFIIKYASPSTQKVLNKPNTDFIGKKFLDTVYEKNVSEVEEVFERLENTKRPIQFEFLLKKDNNTEPDKFLESVCNPLIEEGENLAGFIFTLRDISERKEFEKSLKEAKVRAEKSDKLKSDFLAQMSHEIRTPINSILNFTQLIKNEVEDKLSPDLKDSFKVINTSSNRLIRTIDSILNLSQLQRGIYDLKITEFDITKNIQLVLNEFSTIAGQKNLDLTFNCSCDFQCSIKTDSYIFSQILANLVDNAIKYTKAGSIDVKAESIDNKIQVSVKDTGIGMSKEYLDKLFEPFSQEHTGYSRPFEGSGLGLALVKRYCDLIDAKIEVQSKQGVGTEFTIIF